MRKTVILFSLLLFVNACSEKPAEQKAKKNPAHVGDIRPDPEKDDPEFKRCFEGHIFQYFNDSKGMQYEGEKPAIDSVFMKEYRHPISTGESGLIRIRFVVNCKGETGRFRLIGMNKKYEEKYFPKTITKQLMKITQSLKGWKTKYIEGGEIDYYQYLIFKIEDAQLIEIMP